MLRRCGSDFAHQTFANQHKNQIGWHLPTRFLMRRGPYLIGMWLYVGVALLVFFLLVSRPEFRNLVSDIATAIAPDEWSVSEDAGTLGIFLTSLSLISLLLLKDAQINPFSQFRLLLSRLAGVRTGLTRLPTDF